ncbi:hypothetical protein KKA13_02885 [Patescibacteria group bacterium]|nr:hypothetical protein [Patescibacteria group bacterium]MBU1612908.1 hypothetical protein [Patescibacteria group bacterium]
MTKLTKEQIKKIELLKKELNFKLQSLKKRQKKILADYHTRIDSVKKSVVRKFIDNIEI